MRRGHLWVYPADLCSDFHACMPYQALLDLPRSAATFQVCVVGMPHGVSAYLAASGPISSWLEIVLHDHCVPPWFARVASENEV
jgi:hypothetical protein